jgi:polar amino acid transport system permease protein
VAALREAFDFSLFWEYRSLLLGGLAFNFSIWIGAALLAHTVGLAVCLMRINRIWAFRAIGTVHVEILRNTPEYILLTWVHFVLPLLLTYLLSVRFSFSPLFSSVLALGLAYSGYAAETYRAGISAVVKGQVEAARALGMPRLLILRRVILPQAVRTVLPELLSQMVSLFKATTLVSLIAVPDLLYNVVIVTQEQMRPLPLYTSAAVTYCLIIFAASAVIQSLTTRWRTRGWA